MAGEEKLSVSDKLLLAAFQLEESGTRPFSAEDLVVAAWRMFPDTFGLSGYRDGTGRLCYPDSNRVFAEIMGAKPIRNRGLLVKVGNKIYELTEAGRHLARRLSNQGTEGTVRKAGLGRKIEEHLKKLLTSRAAEKIRNNRIEDLTFYDACAFWGINPMSSAIQLEGQIANLESIMQSARTALGENIATFGHGGQAFGTQDLDTLLAAHKLLLEKFRPELDVIRKRKDERRI